MAAFKSRRPLAGRLIRGEERNYFLLAPVGVGRAMQYKFFVIPIKSNDYAAEEMNRFLRGHRIPAVGKHFMEGGMSEIKFDAFNRKSSPSSSNGCY